MTPAPAPANLPAMTRPDRAEDRDRPPGTITLHDAAGAASEFVLDRMDGESDGDYAERCAMVAAMFPQTLKSA